MSSYSVFWKALKFCCWGWSWTKLWPSFTGFLEISIPSFGFWSLPVRSLLRTWLDVWLLSVVAGTFDADRTTCRRRCAWRRSTRRRASWCPSTTPTRAWSTWPARATATSATTRSSTRSRGSTTWASTCPDRRSAASASCPSAAATRPAARSSASTRSAATPPFFFSFLPSFFRRSFRSSHRSLVYRWCSLWWTAKWTVCAVARDPRPVRAHLDDRAAQERPVPVRPVPGHGGADAGRRRRRGAQGGQPRARPDVHEDRTRPP